MNFLKLCHQNMKNYLLILAVLVMVGCGNRQTHPQEQCNTVDSTTIKRIVPHGEYNSIYHWKTTFNPINSELAFLRKHNVKRLYLRFSTWLGQSLAGGRIVPSTNCYDRFSAGSSRRYGDCPYRLYHIGGITPNQRENG